MVFSVWLFPALLAAACAALLGFGLAALRWRARQQERQATLAREIETLTDRIWLLAEREERYRSLVEAQGDFILRLDGRRIVYANAAYASLFGVEAADLTGSEARLPQLALRPRAMREDGARSFDECLATHEGERWVAWVETALPGPDGRRLVQRVGRDISARIADEDALVEARSRAEAASEAKSRFLATVSHEFRTPLNGILGMADLLADTGLDAEQSTYAQALRTSGEALLALVDDILDFAKVEAGRVELSREPVDIVQLTETVTELMAPRAQAKGIELAAHIAPELPATLLGDRDRLRQILLNLVGNAVKFTASGGVGVSLRKAGGAIEILVADTGPGIPHDRLETIFAEFEQLDHGPGAARAGTGLGLAIVRRLVQAMGGEVGAENRSGGGACFRVLLPLAAAPGGLVTAIPHWPRRQVLVVSPAPFAAGFLAETIRATGACAIVATTQEAARANLAAQGFDAVLVDHAIGDVPAKDLARLAKEAGVRSRLILLSPLGRRHFGAPRSHGFSGFLIKPVRARSLYERLDPPVPSPAAPAPDEAGANAAVVPALHVLVAEDNDINALLLTRTLERLGSTSVRARDGAEALALIEASRRGQARRFDLALFDIRMPGMSGLDCARAVRAAEAEGHGGERLPIIAVTANVSGPDREAALAAGMDDCLAKPLERPALMRLLECLSMRHREPLSA